MIRFMLAALRARETIARLEAENASLRDRLEAEILHAAELEEAADAPSPMAVGFHWAILIGDGDWTVIEVHEDGTISAPGFGIELYERDVISWGAFLGGWPS